MEKALYDIWGCVILTLTIGGNILLSEIDIFERIINEDRFTGYMLVFLLSLVMKIHFYYRVKPIFLI